MDKKKCVIVPPGKKSPGTFTDWDFVKLPDGKWYKIGAGELDIGKDGKPEKGQSDGGPADKSTSDSCEKIYQDHQKEQEKKK